MKWLASRLPQARWIIESAVKSGQNMVSVLVIRTNSVQDWLCCACFSFASGAVVLVVIRAQEKIHFYIIPNRYINLPTRRLVPTTFMKYATSSESSPGVFHPIYIFIYSCSASRSELIFSDSLYPINEFLLDTIKPEVQQNVRRINRHPSNAQWAGGNEVMTKTYYLMCDGLTMI